MFRLLMMARRGLWGAIVVVLASTAAAEYGGAWITGRVTCSGNPSKAQNVTVSMRNKDTFLGNKYPILKPHERGVTTNKFGFYTLEGYVQEIGLGSKLPRFYLEVTHRCNTADGETQAMPTTFTFESGACEAVELTDMPDAPDTPQQVLPQCWAGSFELSRDRYNPRLPPGPMRVPRDAPKGRQIHILSAQNHKYLSVWRGGLESGKVTFNQEKAGRGETWLVWDARDVDRNAGEGLICIKQTITDGGSFISMNDENGASAMTANREQCRAWEQFRWVSAGYGFFALQCSNGRYAQFKDAKLYCRSVRNGDMQQMYYEVIEA